MAKGPGCFYCRWHTKGVVDVPGWAYECSKGLDVSKIQTIEDVLTCPQGRPLKGFQIGGYYSHMELVDPDASIPKEKRNNTCLEWLIWSDGEFPQGEPSKDEPTMTFHLCDFGQLVDFVEFWKRRLNWVDESNERL